jgi:hypothetical protein
MSEEVVAQSIEFLDPYEMLLFLDDELLEHKETKLYKWQIQFLIDFAAKDWTNEDPFKACVCAANGSGKDKYIIAACVCWFTMKYTNAVAIVTSSSGTQLDRQTNTYIKQIANATNAKLGSEVWKVNYRHYECLVSHSTVELFVTDEAGRAEGWHPVVPNGKFAIFTSESKSIPDEIFTALSRCTGFTHRVDVSSPGLPLGFFFNIYTGGVERASFNDIRLLAGQWVKYHVTAYDCVHLNNYAYIEDLKRTMPGGENGAAFKSCVLAEFGTTDELTVIPYQHIWRAVNRTKDTIGHLEEEFNTGGLDLSAGGDETVLSVRNGNKLLKVIPFRFNNTQDTIEFLIEQFKLYGLNHSKSFIYADAGGLGKPIIDSLRGKGWTNIRYVLNQAKAYNERVYLNRGAEMWFNFGKLLETGEVWLCNDERLVRQLATRYYKITEGNKHKLESKLQARAAGRPSPDRGDSVVLCFSSYKTKLEIDDSAQTQKYDLSPEEEDKFVAPLSLKTWAKGEDVDYFVGRVSVYARKEREFKRLRSLVDDINQKQRNEMVAK